MTLLVDGQHLHLSYRGFKNVSSVTQMVIRN